MMTIHLTEKAANRIAKSLEKRGKGIGLRLGIEASGCSGFGYRLEYVDEPAGNDQVFEDFGVKLFVDSENLLHLDGVTVDFVREGLNEGFVFDNPNALSQCGCGKSFSV